MKCNTLFKLIGKRFCSQKAVTIALVSTAFGLTAQVSNAQHQSHDGRWIHISDEQAVFNEDPVPASHNIINIDSVPRFSENRIGFLVICESVKFAPVDPIVAPGENPSHHMHEFFGNPSVNPNTTTQSLANVPTSQVKCTDANDKTAYWTPAVYQNGARATATQFKAYYKSQTTDTSPIPLGLRMVAGNAMSQKNQSKKIGWWQTGPSDVLSTATTTIGKNAMITRQKGHNLTLRINYPNCWDGMHLDSPDHISHMAYAKGQKCPSSHPIKIPQVTTFTTYNVNGGKGFSLASGEWFTFHQDFWNAWDPDHFKLLNERCIHDRNNCRVNGSPALKKLGQKRVELLAERTGNTQAPTPVDPPQTTGNNVQTLVSNIELGKGKSGQLQASATMGGLSLDPSEGYFKNPSVTWTKVSGPGQLSFSTKRRLSTKVKSYVPGNYVARVSVIFDGQTYEDTVNILIKGAAN